MRDRDGYMIEVGQATGALCGELAEKRLKTCPANSDRMTWRADGDPRRRYGQTKFWETC